MTPALEISDLNFRYPDGFSLQLDHLRLEAGQEALLCGPSGCGKSTLLNLIAGLRTPQSGSITVAGESLSQATEAARDAMRGRLIGMVFQTHHLLVGFSAKENLEVAMLFSDIPPAEHPQRADQLLAQLGLERTDVPIERLSVGQQQRVAIARALAGRPSLVLADEPTASLDPDRAKEAMDLLRETVRQHDAALLLSSHDPQMVEQFEHVFDLQALISTGGKA